MNKLLESKIKEWLREASVQGTCGFYFDRNLSEDEQDDDWAYFETMAMAEILEFEEFLNNGRIIHR